MAGAVEATQTDPRHQIVFQIRNLSAYAMRLARAADELVKDSIVKAGSKMDKFTSSTDLRA